jgi:hypothetical protein
MYRYVHLCNVIRVHICPPRRHAANRASAKRGKRAVSCRASSRASESRRAPARSLSPAAQARRARTREPAKLLYDTFRQRAVKLSGDLLRIAPREIPTLVVSSRGAARARRSETRVTRRNLAVLVRRSNVARPKRRRCRPADTDLDRPGIDPIRIAPFKLAPRSFYCPPARRLNVVLIVCYKEDLCTSINRYDLNRPGTVPV